MIQTGRESHGTLAQHIAALKLPIDTFWLDAGWNKGGFPRRTEGNPNPDPVRFPHGLESRGQGGGEDRTCGSWSGSSRSGPCAARGWTASTRLGCSRPSGTPPESRYQERDGFRLLDLANPDARRWAVDRNLAHKLPSRTSPYTGKISISTPRTSGRPTNRRRAAASARSATLPDSTRSWTNLPGDIRG